MKRYKFLILENYNDIFNKNHYNLKELYNRYNRLCFNNELPDIPLKYNADKHRGGVTKARGVPNDPSTWKIEGVFISIFTERTVGQFLGVLLHEMIHVKLFHEGTSDFGGQHGLIFKKELHRLNSMNLGFEVPLTEDITDSKVSSEIKSKEVIVVLLYKNNKFIGIQIFNTKALNDIIESYTHFPLDWWVHTKFNMKLYYSTHIDLMKYPVSQKVKKGSFSSYPVNENFADNIMKEGKHIKDITINDVVK